HVDALEAKIKQLEHEKLLSHNLLIHPDSAAQPQLGSPTLVSSPTRSDTPNKPPTNPAGSSQQRHLPKRYGKSSALHFALAVKVSATAVVQQRESLPNGVQDAAAPPSRINETQSSNDSLSADDTDDVYGSEDEGPGLGVRRSQTTFQLLPQRQLAKYLFDKYFDAVHPIWPLLLEVETQDLFARTWMSDEPIEPIWSVQLNLILAIGCQYCAVADRDRLPPSFEPQKLGGDLYSRAQDYILANAFSENNVEMVQALLLMILFLQMTMRIDKIYLLVGHASRMAQNLGLHISRPESESISPQQHELRRRLWWGCFCFDRISSMLCGRPMGIPYDAFSDYQDRLPQQIDDDRITRREEQPANSPSINAFFRHSVRLYHVMSDVFLRLRAAKSSAYLELNKASIDVRINRPLSNVNALLSLLSTIMELDGHLLSWHENLPSFLKFALESLDHSTPPTKPWISRQVSTLRSRFLGMRMMLHRQTLLFLLQDPERRSWPQNGFQEWPPLFSDRYNDTSVGGSTQFRRKGLPSQVEVTMTHLSAKICVSCALLQIESIDAQTSCAPSGESWSNFNATFTSLCVLGGATALHRDDLDAVVIDLHRAHETVQQGLKIMHNLAVNGAPKAKESEKFVQRLIRATLRRVERDKHESKRTLSPARTLVTTSSPAMTVDALQNSTHSLPQQNLHLVNHQVSGENDNHRYRYDQQSMISPNTHMPNPALTNHISSSAIVPGSITQTDASNQLAFDDYALPAVMGPELSSKKGYSYNAYGLDNAGAVDGRSQDEGEDAVFHEAGGIAPQSDQALYPFSESSDDSIQMLFDNSFDMWSTLWNDVEG
ncbi:MAG: hypothetical protein Q9191_001654, partial [Dirinaria sp. TL-2023a]